ncbi:DUF116 domain-containing protein [Sporosalibacterium faouarense]|uniref:DUF116 domain-containing protein n=1 Tax=Sporosalibacterium faouarense TaxID=516123 RepID=UPI00141C6857|nr:DUF116 domain-containing protein [Sporosalibacterium faouarense]MTI47725.1 DUF116 domain-containing protein [Bacillota bacterium]
MKRDEKRFLFAIIAIISILGAVSAISLFILTLESISVMRVILMGTFVVMIVFIIVLLWTIYMLYKIASNKKISKLNYKILRGLLGFIYPILIWISKVFKIDIDSIRRVYGKINNFLVKTKTIKVKPEEILILLPHCLQDSKCQYKITNDIKNCRMCGKCDIKDIVEISNKYNVDAVVATGGTLAREWIKRKRPKAIIAVACERDLASGINDVKLIPVIGVFNERPNGPCFNTKVNVKNLEEAIKLFLEEE